MPAMRALGVAKHQIVFFYHGRGEIEMGNAVWEAMGLWEGERAGVGSGTGRGRWVRRGEEGGGDVKVSVGAWDGMAGHDESVHGARTDSGFASGGGGGSVRGRGGRRRRVVVDEEEWPPIVGGQW